MSSPVPGRGDTSLGGLKRTPSIPAAPEKPWYANSQWWKQFSVWLSILLSATSLILGSVGEFQVVSSNTQRALNVSGLVVNAASVILSALTSLDWKSAAQIEADLLKHLDSILVQQPVLAETPSSDDKGSQKPMTRTVHVLRLHQSDEEGGTEGHPLLTNSGFSKRKNGRARKRNAARNGNGSSAGNLMD